MDEKKILVVDDSALMRRVICDIINSDKRFQVVARACDGLEAFDLLSRNSYDAVVLDINMPKMNGLDLLRELKKFKISARVLIASTDSTEGAEVTIEALELGALDFIQKPGTSFECRREEFTTRFLSLLYAVSCSRFTVRDQQSAPVKKPFGERTGGPVSALGRGIGVEGRGIPEVRQKNTEKLETVLKKEDSKAEKEREPKEKCGSKLVAIASSTGGPRALQSVIPFLPGNLDAPVLLVQHMPKGFTSSLAQRLDSLSDLEVREACDGDVLEKGVVYIAMGGAHMNLKTASRGTYVIRYSDEPAREGVKPCANYMFESIADTDLKEICCVVLTGMGADGTDGIRNLKKKKEPYVVSQNAETCVVYGMPKSVTNAGLSNEEIPLEKIAEKITEKIGTRN
ncbi:MAG: chemotaxis-specific protein-glutamate methyltransferase CheB [Lachnospiraceae bacterium]|nr:chemotaxis-specific protein-glutamate methyltransferase CheB [Lachnospiraceae bacterium]